MLFGEDINLTSHRLTEGGQQLPGQNDIDRDRTNEIQHSGRRRQRKRNFGDKGRVR